MTVSRPLVTQAIAALSSVEGISMKPDALVEDAALLTVAFDEEEAYKAAVVNTVKALKDISKERVKADALSGAYRGWLSYHYQPRVAQGTPASLRIVFKQTEDSIYVLGFGHRYIPSNIYRRLSDLRLSWA